MAIVVGFVGDEPRINTLQSGRKVASFSMATTEKGYTAKDGTVIPDKTEWHNVVCWGKTAEVVEMFVRKGSQLYVQGKMRTRQYQKDGQTRYSFEIECETMQMLDRRTESQAPAQSQYQQQPQPQYKPQPQYQPTPQQPDSFFGQSDDLPF